MTALPQRRRVERHLFDVTALASAPVHTAFVGKVAFLFQRIGSGPSYMLKIHGKRRFVGFTSDVGGDIWWLPRVQGSLKGDHKLLRAGWLAAAFSIHWGRQGVAS